MDVSRATGTGPASESATEVEVVRRGGECFAARLRACTSGAEIKCTFARGAYAISGGLGEFVSSRRLDDGV